MKWDGTAAAGGSGSGGGGGRKGGGGLDPGWLRKQVERYYGEEGGLGMSVPDLCSTIFDLLSTSRPDTELQNEVILY